MQTSNFIEFLKISEDLEKKNQIQRSLVPDIMIKPIRRLTESRDEA